jgi:hypothetical protein
MSAARTVRTAGIAIAALMSASIGVDAVADVAAGSPQSWHGPSTLFGAGGTPLSSSLIFQHGTETGSRYNPQSNDALPGGFTAADTAVFTSAVWDGSFTSVTLDTLTIGIRQVNGSPDVDVRFFVGEMSNAGALITSSVIDLGVVSLAGHSGAAFVTTPLGFDAGGLSVNLNALTGLANPQPTLSGLFIGFRFEGPGATNALNGIRLTNAPAIGLAFNNFWAYDPVAGVADAFAFTAPQPSFFMLSINGTLVPAPGAIALLGMAGLLGSRRRR